MLVPKEAAADTAGYVAEYLGLGGPNCYAFGETEAIARMRVNHHFSPVVDRGKREFLCRMVTYRPVGPDEASEVLEMLDTPW